MQLYMTHTVKEAVSNGPGSFRETEPEAERSQSEWPPMRNYYAHVVSCLSEGIRMVFVVGTAGVGISSMFSYLSDRFRLENPNETVVIVKCGRSGLVNGCHVLSPRGSHSGAYGEMLVVPGALYVCEGWPRGLPCGNRAVIFSRYPLRITNSSEQRILCLPRWTLAELRRAKEIINPRLPMAEVEKRFELCGGLVKHCLSHDDSATLLGRIEQDVRRTLWSTMRTVGDVESAVRRCESILFQMEPLESIGEPSSYRLVVGSPVFLELIRERLSEFVEGIQVKLFCSLESDNDCPQLLECVTELLCRRKLSNGGTFRLRGISSQTRGYDICLSRNQFQSVPAGDRSGFAGSVCDERGVALLFRFMRVEAPVALKASQVKAVLHMTARQGLLRRHKVSIVWVFLEHLPAKLDPQLMECDVCAEEWDLYNIIQQYAVLLPRRAIIGTLSKRRRFNAIPSFRTYDTF